MPVLHVICPLLAESSDRDDDEDLAPDRAAAEVIDTMALNLPKQVFQPVFEFASISCQNVDPKFREAAVTALGVISEGCLDLMKNDLKPVLHIVLGSLRDPEQMVRGAASFALGQFAEYLQPEIISHYESVLPCILNALEDASNEVKVKQDIISIELYNLVLSYLFMIAMDFLYRKRHTTLWLPFVRIWARKSFPLLIL